MPAVEFDDGSQVWVLQMANSSYGLRRTENDALLHVYWGPGVTLADVVRMATLEVRDRTGSDGAGAYDGREEFPVDGGL